MTAEPKWISKKALLLLHEESLAEFGGANGYRLIAGQPDAIATMLDVASGDIDEAALAVWISANIRAN